MIVFLLKFDFGDSVLKRSHISLVLDFLVWELGGWRANPKIRDAFAHFC